MLTGQDGRVQKPFSALENGYFPFFLYSAATNQHSFGGHILVLGLVLGPLIIKLMLHLAADKIVSTSLYHRQVLK